MVAAASCYRDDFPSVWTGKQVGAYSVFISVAVAFAYLRLILESKLKLATAPI